MEHNIPVDRRTLRSFGLTSGVIVILLFGTLIPWLKGSGWPRWPWILASFLIFMGLIVPGVLKPVYRLWMKFGHFMNRVNTAVILTVVFFFVFTPVGLIMRIFGRDVMHRKFDQKAESYRMTSDNPKTENMERPF